MTNEELDRARSDEATAPEISPADWACADWADPIGFGLNDERHGRAYAAMMARTGWTPPVPVDPDIAEAEAIWFEGKSSFDLVLEGIKRGRALAAAEAKPGMVWVKHDFATAQQHPARSQQLVCVKYSSGYFAADFGANIYWPNVIHYAVITPPEDVA